MPESLRQIRKIKDVKGTGLLSLGKVKPSSMLIKYLN